jgi:hypothetical protein
LEKWVPFSETSVHQSKIELWPAFLVDEATRLVEPLADLVVYCLSGEKLEEKELGKLMRNVEFQLFDKSQVKKLVELLNKEH